MNYVFDASCLIYLGKLGVLEKLNKLKGDKFIPFLVFEEVVKKGIERGEREARYIENLIKNKYFEVRKPKMSIPNVPSISEADREVISLAKETNSIALIDDDRARIVAEFYDLEYHGTLYLILLLIRDKIITKKSSVGYVNEMIKMGFYLSSEKYKEILDVINKM